MAKVKKQSGETIPFHPLAETYPLMDAFHLGRLEESIIERGMHLPIVRWNCKGHEHHGKIIDGRNRYLACLAGKIKPNFVWDKCPEAKLEMHIADLNEERRMLTEEYIKGRRTERVERVVEARKSGKSTRQIAEEEGISQTQVLSDIKVGTEQGCSVEPKNGQVHGKDGKTRPARSRKPKANGEAPTQEELAKHIEDVKDIPVVAPIAQEDDPISEPENVFVDGLGLPVPEELADVFAARGVLKDVNRCGRQLQALYQIIATSPGGELFAAGLKFSGKEGKGKHSCPKLKESLKELEQALPFASICAWCHKKHIGMVDPNCKGCTGKGWLSKWQWGFVPEDERQDAIKHAQEVR